MMKRFCNRQRCLPVASGVAAPAGRHAASPPPRVSTRTHAAKSLFAKKKGFFKAMIPPPIHHTPPCLWNKCWVHEPALV